MCFLPDVFIIFIWRQFRPIDQLSRYPVNEMLTKILVLLTSAGVMSMPLATVTINAATDSSIVPRRSEDPYVRLCMSEHSKHCYRELVEWNICQKIRDPRTYGDEGSLFEVGSIHSTSINASTVRLTDMAIYSLWLLIVAGTASFSNVMIAIIPKVTLVIIFPRSLLSMSLAFRSGRRVGGTPATVARGLKDDVVECGN